MRQRLLRWRTAGGSITMSAGILLIITALVAWVSGIAFASGTAMFELTSGSSFTITSEIHASPACSGPTALLDLGVTDCLVYSVQNNLTTPISVRSIDMGFDPSYPTPPSGCATSLVFPTFSGSFFVPGGESATLGGLPITWTDINSNQDNCKSTTLHFVYSGTAQYTDTTSTALSATPDPTTVGQSVTFTAVVAAANAATDPSGPIGTVTFYQCATLACSDSPTALTSGAVGPNGQTTFSTSSLPLGTSYIEAIYGPTDATTFSASTSNVVAEVVNAPPVVVTPAVGANAVEHASTTTTLAPVVAAHKAVKKAATKKAATKKAVTKQRTPVAKASPVLKATTVHTGEPWAGTGPLAAAFATAGLLLISLGLYRRRRFVDEVEVQQ